MLNNREILHRDRVEEMGAAYWYAQANFWLEEYFKLESKLKELEDAEKEIPDPPF